MGSKQTCQTEFGYEDFFEMKKTPFVRSIPVDDLYMDQDTEEIHNRLLYATRLCTFKLSGKLPSRRIFLNRNVNVLGTIGSPPGCRNR